MAEVQTALRWVYQCTGCSERYLRNQPVAQGERLEHGCEGGQVVWVREPMKPDGRHIVMLLVIRNTRYPDNALIIPPRRRSHFLHLG